MNERKKMLPLDPSRGLRVTTGLQAGATGTVKWYSADKGFGFIIPDIAGPEVFAPSAAVMSPRGLRENQRVDYDPVSGPKGPQAANIRPAS